MNFNDIVGHDYVKKQLEKAIETNKLSHAHIICGEDGIGKSLIAKAMAIKILGKSVEREYADIIEWKPKKKSIGVDEIRKINEEINKKPYEGDKKVIIIYNSEIMTNSAQNAFLKTIEEPPKGVVILLLCDNLDVILETIKSRCQTHKLRRLNVQQIRDIIYRDYPELKEDEIKPIIAFSEGIPGRIQRFLEDKSFLEIRDNCIDILVNCADKNTKELAKNEEILIKYKSNWEEILNCFMAYIRDIFIYKETNDKELVINVDKIEYLTEVIDKMSFKKLTRYIDIINYVKGNLQRNVSPAITFNVMLLKFQEV